MRSNFISMTDKIYLFNSEIKSVNFLQLWITDRSRNWRANYEIKSLNWQNVIYEISQDYDILKDKKVEID